MSSANASAPGHLRRSPAQEGSAREVQIRDGSGLRGVHHVRSDRSLTLRDYLFDVLPLTRWDGELIVVLQDRPFSVSVPPSTDDALGKAGLLLACGLGPRAQLVRRSDLDGSGLRRLMGQALPEGTPRTAIDLLLLRGDLLLVSSFAAHRASNGSADRDGPDDRNDRADPPGESPESCPSPGLLRNLAHSFNTRYVPVFPLPDVVPLERVGLQARVGPGERVGPQGRGRAVLGARRVESPGGDVGSIGLLDSPTRIAAAVRATRTDLDPRLSYDPDLRGGISRLAEVLGSLTDRHPAAALAGIRGTGRLKTQVTEAVVQALRPLQLRYRQLEADPAPVHERLAEGSRAARELIGGTLAAVRTATT
ncbi:MAG: tryptophanyl-tRNA synthetase [Actinomycetota bacterium]|nr:tryptophanyl-tRNA synthetase [Actinomycetota bacterium]